MGLGALIAVVELRMGVIDELGLGGKSERRTYF
jgi:hypothetical protein